MTAPEGLATVLREGPALLGTFLQAPTAITAEVVARSGVDFTCVEGEHSGIGIETMQMLVTASGHAGVPALVRVRRNDPTEIAAALDAGAAGVIAPRVDSVEEAHAAVTAARFPPLGSRGLGPGRATGYGRAIGEHLATANETLVIGVQIESAAALGAVEQIVAVPGLDFVLVGPGDLALSLGVPLGDPTVDEAAATVLAVAAAAGVAAGIWAPTAAAAASWLRLGARIVIVGSDLGFLGDAVEAAFTELRASQAR